MPIWKQHISKRGNPDHIDIVAFLNYWVQKGVCFNWTSIHLFHQRVLHSGVLCTAEITFLLLNGILSLCFEFQPFVVVLSIYVYLLEPYTRIKKVLSLSCCPSRCKYLQTISDRAWKFSPCLFVKVARRRGSFGSSPCRMSFTCGMMAVMIQRILVRYQIWME